MRRRCKKIMLILSQYLQGFRGMDDFPVETGDEMMEESVLQEGQKYAFHIMFLLFSENSVFEEVKS